MQPQLLRTALGHTLPYTGKPAESSPVGRHQFGAPTHIGLDHLVRVCTASSGVFGIGVVNCVFTHTMLNTAAGPIVYYCISSLDTIAIVASVNVRS